MCIFSSPFLGHTWLLYLDNFQLCFFSFSHCPIHHSLEALELLSFITCFAVDIPGHHSKHQILHSSECSILLLTSVNIVSFPKWVDEIRKRSPKEFFSRRKKRNKFRAWRIHPPLSCFLFMRWFLLSKI